MSDEVVNRDGIIHGRHASDKRELSQRMRKNMTHAEALLWDQLRANRLAGFQFRRQQVIDGLIVDFYCHAAGLVIECDGRVHETQVEQDRDRDAVLERRGLTILRITNDDIEHAMAHVLQKIVRVSKERERA